MSKQRELEEYRLCVYNIWVVSKFPRTFADDLMPVMMENGFLIDNVTASYGGDGTIAWVGSCYDVALASYKFKAVWTLNMEKFSASDLHYYELTDLEIE